MLPQQSRSSSALLGDTKHSHLLIQTLLALASIGPAAESAAPQIKPLLESPNDATIPVAAAYALGSIGANNADAELRRALEKDDLLLQMIAAWRLQSCIPTTRKPKNSRLRSSPKD